MKKNKEKSPAENDFSVKFSIIITRIVFVLGVVCLVAAPFIVRAYDNKYVLTTGQTSVYWVLLITLYCVAVPAIILVVALDKLLHNISGGKPFIKQNVTCLRVISYSCFAVSVIFIPFSFFRPFAILVVIAAAFFGLILRVVKNVFQKAVEIREENDFTI